MYGGNCRAQKDQLKDVQQLQVSRLAMLGETGLEMATQEDDGPGDVSI